MVNTISTSQLLVPSIPSTVVTTISTSDFHTRLQYDDRGGGGVRGGAGGPNA